MEIDTHGSSSPNGIATLARRAERTMLALSLVLPIGTAQALTLCVHDAAGLEFALAAAAGNAEDDEIRLQRGNYAESASLRFLYLADDDETFDLEVSGDWNAGCTVQGQSPTATVIDGNNTEHGLEIWFRGSFATVRLLTFVAGMTSAGNSDGGGLQILSLDDNAVVYRIESNLFIANEGVNGGGLSATGAQILQVINNVFVANTGTLGASAAHLGAADSGAVYFANNTVVANDSPATAVQSVAPLGSYVVNNNFGDNGGADLHVYFDPDWDPVDVLRNNNINSWSIPNLPIVENNINVDPEYQSGFLNFTPVRNSPLVDAGTEPEFLAFWYLTDADINGSPRVVGPHVDIGAFENDKIFVDGFDPAGPFGSAQ